MDDIFARIGLVLSGIIAQSTIHGPARSEAERLVEELRSSDTTISRIVEERVRAHTEALAGQVAALTAGADHLRAIVFSTSMLETLEAGSSNEEELETLRGLFKRTPDPLDRDHNGERGGDLPDPPTEDPDHMTIAMAEAWLDERKIDRKGVTKRDDLRELVRKAQAEAAPEGGVADITITEGGAGSAAIAEGGRSDVIPAPDEEEA